MLYKLYFFSGATSLGFWFLKVSQHCRWNIKQISSDVVLYFTLTHSSFYDSMWSKFNALFVVSPMGHFTVGWVGKGMVTILCRYKNHWEPHYRFDATLRLDFVWRASVQDENNRQWGETHSSLSALPLIQTAQPHCLLSPGSSLKRSAAAVKP